MGWQNQFRFRLTECLTLERSLLLDLGHDKVSAFDFGNGVHSPESFGGHKSDGGTEQDLLDDPLAVWMEDLGDGHGCGWW